jgi:hypothetical protein
MDGLDCSKLEDNKEFIELKDPNGKLYVFSIYKT